VRLPAAFTADWPLKLTSLGLAILLWLIATSEESASSLLSVELRVQPPSGRSIVHGPDPLRVTVVGPRRDLLKLSTTHLLLTRILPDSLTADSVELDVTPSDVVLPQTVSARVQDIQPRRVVVELNRVEERTVAVRPVVRVAPDSGFELVGGVSVVPGEVRIAGPRERVRVLDSITTVPLEIVRADGPSEERLSVDTSGLGPVRVFPSRVTVRINVQATAERTLGPVPIQLPSVMASRWRSDRDSVTVRVHGPRARLAALTPDSVAVSVEAPHRAGSSTLRAGSSTLRAVLRVLLPTGLTGKAEPDSVTLLRRGDRA
jgi:YbbR domain-containing protein